jgi:hypothetical protein
VVSREAILVFYKFNTFSFQGYHSWNPIVSWLEGIGPQNRELLTRLRIEAHSPMHVRQEADGTRVELERADLIYEYVYQRHPHLAPSTGDKEGIVENINPVPYRNFV